MTIHEVTIEHYGFCLMIILYFDTGISITVCIDFK